MNDTLNKKIEDMDLTVKSYNAIKRAGINTVGDLLKMSKEDLLNVRNLRDEGVSEILKKTSLLGLTFLNQSSGRSAPAPCRTHVEGFESLFSFGPEAEAMVDSWLKDPKRYSELTAMAEARNVPVFEVIVRLPKTTQEELSGKEGSAEDDVYLRVVSRMNDFLDHLRQQLDQQYR